MDYRIDVQNPFMSALEGFQTAQQMQAMRAQAEQIRAAQQRKAEMQTALGQFAARERTPEEYQKLMTLFPEMADQVNVSLQALNENQKKNKINQLLPIYAALETGNSKIAVEKLDENIAAARNSGMETEAKMMEQIKQNIEMGPEGLKGAKTSAEIFLYNAMGDDFFKMKQSLTGGKSHIQSSEILPDGTVIQISSLGDVIIKDAGGSILTGKDAVDAVKRAKEYGISIEELKSKARSKGTYSVKQEYEPGLEREKAAGKEIGKSEEERQTDIIDKGLVAAESIPNINRGIQLLDQVKTGGIDSVALSAKRFFGVEGANEGELSYRLSKAVLSQLKSTFGAQFTAAEGDKLDRIEAGFGKSPAVNRRLLQQAFLMAKQKANRAKIAAKRRNDDATVEEIDNWLNFDITKEMEAPTEQTPQSAPMQGEQMPQINSKAQYDALPSGAEYINANNGKKYRKP